MKTTAIRIELSFAAPVERVFAAWTDAELFKQWAWGALSNNTSAEISSRKGGRYRVTTLRLREDGVQNLELAFSGEYLEFEPGSRIRCTLTWESPMPYGDTAESFAVEFLPDEQGTRMVFTHDGIPDDGKNPKAHEVGWRSSFEFLDRVLKAENDEG